jgi:hypothetical protein
VYHTCLFCNADLGRNEVVEHFPVGRRLAFDAARGRLWVVCRKCERWNLTPLEERWEAIEEAERLFRDTRLRVSTDNIGLAKLREGLELVRVGTPQRPEFAAWRYGDQFGRRRRRQMIVAGGGIVAIGAVVAGGIAAGVGMGAFGYLITQAVQGVLQGNPNARVAVVPVPGRAPLPVRRRHLAETSIDSAPSGGLLVQLRHIGGSTLLEGRDAERAAALLMPHANRFGGNRQTVAAAVGEIENEGSAEAFLARIADVARITTRPAARMPKRWIWGTKIPRSGLFGLHEPQRLALEMALHEESERRALEGELAELERAWQQAEEIAAIADNLLLPESVDDFVRREREKLRDDRAP